MKRIIICCDGTAADENRRQPSNVLLTYRAVKDQPDQYAWYDRGVGTGGAKDKIWGGATGDGLTLNIEQAYLQLVEHYEDGDEIFLFGFSRGAFTVRSLGGLIRNIGLLRPERAGALAVGFELYTNKQSGPDSNTAKKFRATNSREVTIKFMGVYDTVGSMAVIQKFFSKFSGEEKWFNKWGFHDYRLSSLIENGYQALAIDEKRRAFRPQIWDDPQAQYDWPANSNDDYLELEIAHPELFNVAPTAPSQEQIDAGEQRRNNQHIEQQWFRGCHTDIGGGNYPPGLSNLSITWMLNAAQKHNLTINPRYIEVNANHLSEQRIHESRGTFYKLMPAFYRPIGTRSPDTESLNSSVCELVNDPASGYKPNNLSAYLEKNPNACK